MSGAFTPDVPALIAAAIAAIPSTFVSATPMMIQGLMDNYPPSATYAGLYARVSNLYNGTSTTTAGGVDEILRCRYDASNATYRWVPQREAFNMSLALVTGATTLLPLVTPPTLRLTGTLTGNIIVTPSILNAYIGQKFTVLQNSTLGIFVTTITGLLGSNLTLLGNTAQEIEYTAAGWSKATP